MLALRGGLLNFSTTALDDPRAHTSSTDNFLQHSPMYSRCLFLIASLASAIFCGFASAETYDIDASTGFRMERYRAPVPQSIPGGITVDNEMMIEALDNDDWILIDVYPPKGLGPDPIDGHWVISESRRSMVGATWLPEVGRGHLEADAIDYFQRNLEALTNGDKSRAMVFYCTSDCWQSWNAARRAINWGYSAVHWYPLGSDGWLEEGGELVPVEPVNFFGNVGDGDGDGGNVEDDADNAGNADNPASFPPSASIYLLDQNAEELKIGRVEFAPLGDDQYNVNVTIDSPAFSDQFLSMRPFDCIAEAAEWYCYLPYPYELRRTVSIADLTELEYQLLFIWKSPSDFGIDAWNGVYYQLAWQDDGSLHGTLLQGDLNVLAEPPEPNSHPIDLGEFIEEGGDKRRFPALVIRP